MDDFEAVNLAPPRYAPGAETARLLEGTAPWVRWVSIFLFIMIGLMVFVGLIGGIAGAATGEMEMVLLLVLYPLMALLYVFPAVHLFRYSSRIRDFLVDRTEEKLVVALEAQRAFWKFVGILTIVSIALVVVMFFIFFVAGVMMGASAI